MDSLVNLKELVTPNVSQLELIPTLFSFIMCVIMSFIVRDFYIKRSYSLTGKMNIGSIIPVLSTVVFLVIIVVKSSLALSLGLVGALSIVRFRTPIKEPEELVYLFLAIAVGLGYGAGHLLITTILTLAILLVIYIWLSNRKKLNINEYNLVISWKNNNLTYEKIFQEISFFVNELKLVRIDTGSEESTAVMLISPKDQSFIDLATNKLKQLDSEINVTFYEAKTNW